MNHTPSVSVRNIVLGEGIPKICIPLVSTCLDALLNDMKKAIWKRSFLLYEKQPGILLFFLPSAPKRKAEIWLPAFYSIKNW